MSYTMYFWFIKCLELCTSVLLYYVLLDYKWPVSQTFFDKLRYFLRKGSNERSFLLSYLNVLLDFYSREYFDVDRLSVPTSTLPQITTSLPLWGVTVESGNDNFVKSRLVLKLVEGNTKETKTFVIPKAPLFFSLGWGGDSLCLISLTINQLLYWFVNFCEWRWNSQSPTWVTLFLRVNKKGVWPHPRQLSSRPTVHFLLFIGTIKK